MNKKQNIEIAEPSKYRLNIKRILEGFLWEIRISLGESEKVTQI